MMTRRGWIFFAASVWVLCGGLADTVHAQSARPDQASAKSQPVASKDEEAIRKSAKDFSQAFEKGDAKAIGAMWAEHGEYEDDAGKVLRGREAIEKAYAEAFKGHSGAKIDVEVQSVRFLTPDVAVEEGILHESGAGRELPTTTRYSAIDVRENGQWKIAQCKEVGNGQDHLDDLNWLVGKWKGSAKDGEMSISFAWDEKLPILLAKVTKKAPGKNAVSGTIKIGFDPRRGHLHSWHSEEDGSHSQSQWHRDGSQWVLQATGMTADGTDTTGEYVLGRLDNNNFTWRAVNRMLGDQPVPDTVPVKLTRVSDGK
jgi:uncharacterized protein (TIGR02246 family)